MNIEQMAKERKRARVHVLLAHRDGLLATLTPDEWFSNIHLFHGLCAYCQQKPFEALDHLIPTSKGGATTADNCVPVCTRCNARKSGLFVEFQDEMQTLEEKVSYVRICMNTKQSRPKAPFYTEDMTSISIALPEDLLNEIKRQAGEECRPVSRQILWMVNQALKENEV